jgi:hypothetical protein
MRRGIGLVGPGKSARYRSDIRIAASGPLRDTIEVSGSAAHAQPPDAIKVDEIAGESHCDPRKQQKACGCDAGARARCCGTSGKHNTLHSLAAGRTLPAAYFCTGARRSLCGAIHNTRRRRGRRSKLDARESDRFWHNRGTRGRMASALLECVPIELKCTASLVIAGLDPAIHAARRLKACIPARAPQRQVSMDTWVKSGQARV